MNHKSALKGIQTIQVLVRRFSLELAECDGLFGAIYMDDAKLVAAYSEEQAALMISQPGLVHGGLCPSGLWRGHRLSGSSSA